MKNHNTSSESGFMLLEALMSILLFAIIATSIANAFTTHLKFNLLSEQRSEAIQSAQQVLDMYRVQDPTSMPSGGAMTTNYVTIGTRTYGVGATFCPASASMYCTSNNVRFIHIDVIYKGSTLYAVDTVFSQLR